MLVADLPKVAVTDIVNYSLLGECVYQADLNFEAGIHVSMW